MSKYNLDDILLNPILRMKPDAIDEDTYLQYMFHTASRPIAIYRITRDRHLPGTFLEGGIYPKPGDLSISRTIRKGDLLAARYDEVLMRIEIEHKAQVFQLLDSEWEDLRQDLKLTRKQEEIK